MTRFICSFIILSFCISLQLVAQGPTDLYLLQLQKSTDNTYHVFLPRYLSGFNIGGYTNQPWFAEEGELLVSVRKAEENQNDIYQLSLKTKKIKQLTKTTSNEYSPRLDPTGKMINALRQIEGDSIHQQVIQFSRKGDGYKCITPEMKNIGYYTWMKENELGLFQIDGESNRLVYLNLEEKRTRRITSSIGRTLLADSDGSLIFVHKFTENYWYIKKYNPSASIVDIIVEILPGVEDFTVAPDGTYFIGKDNKLFCFHPDLHTAWKEVADLSKYGIEHITRLAVSPDGKQLALVSNHHNK